MPSAGDKLLFAISSWGETSWATFKAAHDAVCGSDDDQPEQAHRYSRFRALTTLRSLGHCEYARSEGRVLVGPPVFAALPLPGLPRAVLCGARAPGAIEQVKSLVARSKAACRVQLTDQSSRSPCAPVRVILESQSSGSLAEFCKELGISFSRTPPAWRVLAFSACVSDFAARLEWVEEPDLDWSRMDFSPRELRFTVPLGEAAELLLSRYEDPTRPRRLFYLRRGSERAVVSPVWARFLVLKNSGKSVFFYDRASCRLHVPLFLPLPPLLERALCLSSGLSAAEDSLPLKAKEEPMRSRVFDGVPHDVALGVGAKVGQELVLI